MTRHGGVLPCNGRAVGGDARPPAGRTGTKWGAPAAADADTETSASPAGPFVHDTVSECQICGEPRCLQSTQ